MLTEMVKYSRGLRDWSGESLAVKISWKCCKQHGPLYLEM